MRRRATALTVALLLLLAAAACGGGSDNATTTPTRSTGESSSPSTSSEAPTITPEPTPDPLAPPPVRDLLDLARRYRGYDGPDVARTTPLDLQVGDNDEFEILDLDGVSSYMVTATVRGITENAYFYVEDGAGYTDLALQEAMDSFEETVWPVVTENFGVPNTPGVDGDPRITILHADLGLGGYVSGSDGFPRDAVPTSNEREMLYIHVGALGTGADYDGLVAHELQHLVHDNYDKNEESWVNEGLSEVAWQMAGGEPTPWDFFGRPDTQLNAWPEGDTAVHYAESELFFTYLLDHYGGRENANALISRPENGIEGIDTYLEDFGTTFDEVYGDFIVANYLDGGEDRFTHLNLNGRTTAVEEIEGGDGTGSVHQFGTDYLELDMDAGGVFHFEGDATVTIGIPETDGAFWWSNRSDGIDTRLTREIDLTDVDAATLTFDLWYAIEEGWDWGYVSVSTDGGATWLALAGDHTTSEDVVGSSFGIGYTGRSESWVAEEISLDDYSGEEVLLRFEYVADDAINETGMAIDNIRIDAIGLEDDGESVEGWLVEGWRVIDGPLPQEYILRAISADGDVTARAPVQDGMGSILLGDEPTAIVISAITRETTEVATYRWSLE